MPKSSSLALEEDLDQVIKMEPPLKNNSLTLTKGCLKESGSLLDSETEQAAQFILSKSKERSRSYTEYSTRH